jgi:hypothetical protein
MTINIALATYDSIILGCDSLSSMVETVIFPFKASFATDATGQIMLDAQGNPLIPFDAKHFQDVATTVFGGVSKMFCLYDNNDTVVGAVTAGLATLSGISIAEQAKRFKKQMAADRREFSSVEEVARAFHDFMRVLWELDYPEQMRADRPIQFLPTVQFIVAGFGANDGPGKVYKMDIAQQLLKEQFPDGQHSGICWGGISNYVERLMQGIDDSLKITVGRELASAMSQQRQLTIADISQALDKANVKLPEDLELEITEQQPPTLPWDSVTADIDFANLSTQYAVELIELLVNTQSGMQRFARGIPTVGGRTHIGVLKRGEEFQLLNEPKLQHKHTGYGDEF